MNRAESHKPVERAKGIAARQPGDGRPIHRISLTPNLGQPDDRHPRVFLETAHRIAGFDRVVLLDVTDEQEPVVIGCRESAEVAHFAHRNEARFIDNQQVTAGRLLESRVDEELLQGVGIRGQFLPEHVGGAGRRGTTENPSARAFDAGHNVLDRRGFSGARIALKNDDAGT